MEPGPSGLGQDGGFSSEMDELSQKVLSQCSTEDNDTVSDTEGQYLVSFVVLTMFTRHSRAKMDTGRYITDSQKWTFVSLQEKKQ